MLESLCLLMKYGWVIGLSHEKHHDDVEGAAPHQKNPIGLALIRKVSYNFKNGGSPIATQDILR